MENLHNKVYIRANPSPPRTLKFIYVRAESPGCFCCQDDLGGVGERRAADVSVALGQHPPSSSQTRAVLLCWLGSSFVWELDNVISHHLPPGFIKDTWMGNLMRNRCHCLSPKTQSWGSDSEFLKRSICSHQSGGLGWGPRFCRLRFLGQLGHLATCFTSSCDLMRSMLDQHAAFLSGRSDVWLMQADRSSAGSSCDQVHAFWHYVTAFIYCEQNNWKKVIFEFYWNCRKC